MLSVSTKRIGVSVEKSVTSSTENFSIFRSMLSTIFTIAALKKTDAHPGIEPERLTKILAMTNEIRATYAHAPLLN